MQLLVLLVPVFFGLMGFAFDLGRIYLIKGELKTAANAMALAAAQQLIGTEASVDAASTAARLTLNDANGNANRYDFSGLLIGQTNGYLNSEAQDPAFFASVATATAGDSAGAASGTTARHARVEINADAPLTFWSFIPIAASRKVTVAASAVAGVSAPLCVACGIQSIAVAAVDQTDTTDFGFIPASRYTFASSCSGNPVPTGLQNAPSVIQYVLLNRYNTSASVFADEQSQAFRIGAQGLPGSTDPTQSCFNISTPEQIWATAAPGACSAAQPPSPVVSMNCGLTMRFDNTLLDACSAIAEVSTMASLYTPDTDTTDLDDYTQYIGNGRRVITVPIVDALSAAGDMNILGFRQFLIEPDPSGVNITPNDRYGRYVVLYIGSVVPLKQGSFGACQQTAGPGKVILHQ